MMTSARAPRKTDTAWLGLDSRNGRYLFGAAGAPLEGIIEPNQVADICTRSHVNFRAERLFVLRSIAPHFLIRNIFVGCKVAGPINQVPIIAEPFAVDFDDLCKLGVEGALPADLFDGTHAIRINVDRPALALVGGPLPLPWLPIAVDLIFQVENIGIRSHRFLGSLVGQAEWS